MNREIIGVVARLLDVTDVRDEVPCGKAVDTSNLDLEPSVYPRLRALEAFMRKGSAFQFADEEHVVVVKERRDNPTELGRRAWVIDQI